VKLYGSCQREISKSRRLNGKGARAPKRKNKMEGDVAQHASKEVVETNLSHLVASHPLSTNHSFLALTLTSAGAYGAGLR
jgi:hypothetical protein